MGLNNVSLTGRLTKDPEMRYTPNGKAVSNFTLAVNKMYKQENEPDADFINCVVWGKTAESLAQYQKKGNRVGVEGSIQTRNYENKQGQRVFVTEVLARTIHFLEPANNNRQQGQQRNNQNQQQNNFQQGQQNNYQNQQQGNYQNQQQNNYQNNYQNQQGNFQNQQPMNNQNQQQGQAQPFDISDDDLPF